MLIDIGTLIIYGLHVNRTLLGCPDSIRDVRTRAARRSPDSFGNFMSADSNDSVGLIEMVMLLQNCSKNENEIIDPVSFW